MSKELKVDKAIAMGDVTLSPFISAGIGDAPVEKTGLHLEYDGGPVDPYVEVSKNATLKQGQITLSDHAEVGAHIHVGESIELTVAATADQQHDSSPTYGVTAGVKWTF